MSEEEIGFLSLAKWLTWSDCVVPIGHEIQKDLQGIPPDVVSLVGFKVFLYSSKQGNIMLSSAHANSNGNGFVGD